MSTTKYIAKPRLKEILSEEENKEKYPTQKDFALAVGVKEPTISRFDTQTRYDINTLISISRELKLAVEDLFIIEENPDYIKIEYPKYDEKNVATAQEFLHYLIEKKKLIPTKTKNNNSLLPFDFNENLTDLELEEITDMLEAFSKAINKKQE